MPFIRDDNKPLREGIGNLAFVGEAVKILGAPIAIELPPSRRPQTCEAECTIVDGAITFTSPGFRSVRLSRGQESATIAFVVLPIAALDSEASRAFRDRYDNHATMPPKNPAAMREALAAAVARDVTRERLISALAVDPSGVCGELVGKPGHGFPTRAYGAPGHVTPLDVRVY